MHQAVKEDFSGGQDHKRASFFTLQISVFAVQKCAENPRNIFIYSFILGAILLFFILRMEVLLVSSLSSCSQFLKTMGYHPEIIARPSMSLLFTHFGTCYSFFKVFFKFIFGLQWVFGTVCGLSLLVASRGYSLAVVHRLLIVVTSLVAEHGL